MLAFAVAVEVVIGFAYVAGPVVHWQLQVDRE